MSPFDLHKDALANQPRQHTRRYSTLTLALIILAVLGWGLAFWLLVLMGGL